MHGLKTLEEINASAVKTFEQKQAEHAANLAAAEKINALRTASVTDADIAEVKAKRAEQRQAAVAKLLSKTDAELVGLVEAAILAGTFLPSTLEEALARRLCEKIGRTFLVEKEGESQE